MSFFLIMVTIKCSLFTLLCIFWLHKAFSFSFRQPNVCKFTVRGTEYVGHSKETRTNKFCQKWDSSAPHIVSPDIEDSNFPDGTKKAAKNFCRNPDNSLNGPWCYTTSSSVVREPCSLSLCAYNNCQWSGLGMEYSGNKQVSILNNECMAWSLVKETKDEKLFDMGFPDGNRMLAHKYCRNPTGDPIGPWCYVPTEGFDLGLSQDYIKEYCDIPSCFDREDTFTVIETIDQFYTHMSTIKSDGHSLNISILLWQSDQWKNSKLQLALTVLPIPVSGEQLRKWDMGFEIIINNDKTGATPKQGEESTWEAAPMILKGTDWVNLTLEWSNGFIVMKYIGDNKYIFLHEYSEESKSILGAKDWKISYYSIIGSPAYINMYGSEDVCEEHITYTANNVRYFPIRYDKLTRVLDFHLRAEKDCVIVLKQTPMSKFLPDILITLNGPNNDNSITVRRNSTEVEILSIVPKLDVLSYWKWVSFTISIVSSRIVMYVKQRTGLHPVFDITHDVIPTLRWFGIGSNLTAHWTLYCSPDDYKIPDPLPPECSVSNKDADYQGHQWTTFTQKPCLPWVHESITESEKDFILDRTKEEAMNFCRNPTDDPDGTYCYAYNLPYDLNIVKEHCFIRKCRLKDCRVAGVATDYAGPLDKTITNRTCQKWTSNKPHNIPRVFHKNDLFPERDSLKASNYCRNPSGDIGGPWCYTLDPELIFDLCDVPDCTYPDQCTALVMKTPNRKIYILPKWRTEGFTFRVKMWVPSKYSGLMLFLFPMKGQEHYKLLIGGDTNENVSLHYFDIYGRDTLLKKIHMFHILSSGRWTGFTLKFSPDKITLFYENIPKPLFHWQYGNETIITPFNPVFFNYASSSYGYIGVNFRCDEAQTQITSLEKEPTVFYPVNMWMPDQNFLMDELILYFRGSDEILIELNTLPLLGPDIKLRINTGVFHDQISVQVKYQNRYQTVTLDRLDDPVFDNKNWTEIKISMKEFNIKLRKNGVVVSEWKNPRPLRIYYFTILSQNEEVTWIVNKSPPNLDGGLRHGGWGHWSSWNCTVTCGSGKGVRYRTCTNPEPSIFGSPCIGSSEEIGLCNTFDCGELSPDLHEVINYRLRRYVYNVRIANLQTFYAQCYKDILSILKDETPHYIFYWVQNGIRITPMIELQSINLDNSTLTIPLVKQNNSGVYACIVKNNASTIKVLQVTALTVVTSDFTNKVREGQQYLFKCNNKVLEHLYGHLSQTWLYNGSDWKIFGKSSKGLVDDLLIHPVTRNLTGVWECEIHQDELNLTWTTNWIRLRVLPRPTFITHLLEDTFLGYLLGWISNEGIILAILITFFILVIIGTGVFTFYIIRLQKQFDERRKARGKYVGVSQVEPTEPISETEPVS